MARSVVELGLAADLLDPPVTGAAVYFDDPGLFVQECFVWDAEDEGPTAYQLKNLRLLVKEKRLAQRGPHGLGKTTSHAWALLWFALTRDARGKDWKCITTASAWRQLEKFLWPEVHKWAKKLDWEKLDRKPFSKGELMVLSLKLKFGEAFAVACEDPAKIEGAHADSLLYIFDESKTVPGGTFDAAEGAFSGAGDDTAQEAFAFASSTPGPTNGRFYEICSRKPGLQDWKAVHITLEDVIKANRVSREWAEMRALQWGRESAVFANRVLGEFKNSDEDGVIPLGWIEASNERFERLAQQDDEIDPLQAVGVDVARSGSDRTVVALRFGHAIRELRRYDRQGTMDTSGRVQGILEAHYHPARHSYAVVDVIGIGAGVVDRLREVSGSRVIGFNASEKSRRKDSTNELGFLNKRAAAWWALREMLDPDSSDPIALPPDDELIGDLTSPTWKVTSTGKIQIESKDDIRKRLGRSTDTGDAVVMAFWPEAMGPSFDSFADNQEASFFATAPSGGRTWASTLAA